LLMILIVFLCLVELFCVPLVSTVFASQSPVKLELVFKALPVFTSHPCPDTGR